MVIFNGEPKKNKLWLKVKKSWFVQYVCPSLLIFLRIKEIVCCTLHGSSSVAVHWFITNINVTDVKKKPKEVQNVKSSFEQIVKSF